MRRADVLQRLGELVVDLAPVAVNIDADRQLSSLVRTARVAFGARSVSVAVVTDEGLRYVAADGDGAEGIRGALLPTGSGIAGYVAMSGQSLAVDGVENDPRFARAVAESVGYIPTTLLAVPVVDDADDVVGVISVLDRSAATVDALALASAFAAQAALADPDARRARTGEPPAARRSGGCGHVAGIRISATPCGECWNGAGATATPS